MNLVKHLTADGQRLIVSFVLYNVVDPILWLFVNAFLFRETQDIRLIALYNLAIYAGLPSGFYLNGRLLKKFSTTFPYIIGSLLQGLTVIVLIFSSSSNLLTILAFGFSFGFASGIFWSNRNFLTLKTIASSQRIFFSSLEANSGVLINIIIPAIIGWFIVFGEKISLYSPKRGYEIVAFVGLSLCFLVGYVVRKITIPRIPLTSLRLKKPSSAWRNMRWFTFMKGLFGVEGFLPTLMVLTFVGNENYLGVIQSAAALISAATVYTIAKKAEPRHSFAFFAVNVAVMLLAGASFSILFSAVGVILYFGLSAMASQFRWVGANPLGFDTIDHEEKISKNHHYSYILDQEIFLNLGRISATLLFVMAYSMYPQLAFRFTPIVLAFTQLLTLWFAKKMSKTLHQ